MVVLREKKNKQTEETEQIKFPYSLASNFY